MTRSNSPTRLRCAFTLLLTSVLALALTGTTNAATDTPAPAPAAAQTIEGGLAALKAFVEQDMRDEFAKMTPDQRVQPWRQHCRAVREKAFAIHDSYKSDPRRWDVVQYLYDYPPDSKFQMFGEPEPKDAPLSKNEAAEEKAYKSRLAEIETAMAAATDVPADVREDMAYRALDKKFDDAWKIIREKQKPAPDIAALRAAVDTFLADWPDSWEHAYQLVRYYIGLEKEIRETSEAEIVKTFAQSPNAIVRKYAKERLAFWDAVSKPIEMTFTAVDGREVDLAKLRGKIVLIDFWATWCGACTLAIPDMKTLYSKYHDKGLEIVGIALENFEYAPDEDTPEQTEKKIADAKKNLLGFIEKQQMPWPQYFDGKGFKTDHAKKYFIHGVPTIFILDKDGKFVAEHVGYGYGAGEEFEKKVKPLLGL